MNNDLGSYRDFIETFLSRGYESIFFQELHPSDRQLVLRHDIDFDTNLALQVAQLEVEMGVKSTFFFLLRSGLYNLFSSVDFENVIRIKELGHKISLHYDPLIYEDFIQGLEQEVEVFSQMFQTPVDIISFHRPTEFFQQYDNPIQGVEHTYQSKYFREIKYFSDSTGVWRYGHPFDSPEFANDKPLHILIHPIWWMTEGRSNHDKLRSYFRDRINTLKVDFSNNCMPFREIYESI